MPSLSDRSKRVLRRMTACVLIYSLVFQGMALALAGVSSVDAADNAGGVAIELCHHDGGTSDAPSQTPGPFDDICCIVCLAGASYVPPTLAFAHVFHPIAFAPVRWPVAVSQLPSRTVNANTRPRGPPLIA
jgi:hypothetical protein